MEKEITEYNRLREEMLKKFAKSIFKYGVDILLCILLLSFCLIDFLFGGEGVIERNGLESYLVNDLYCCDVLFYAIQVFLLIQFVSFKKLGLRGSGLVAASSAAMLLVYIYYLYWVNFIYIKGDELVVYIFRSLTFQGLWTALAGLFVQGVLFLLFFRKSRELNRDM